MPELADRELVAEVRSTLAAAGDPELAAGQQRYMKSEMPYYGVTLPGQRLLLKPLLKAHPPQSREVWEATVRVLHESDGKRQVVSHFNKATKGRIVRALLEDGRDPRSPARLAEVLRDLGWAVEVGEPTPKGTQLDVVVSDL